jgi:hypothetical protein
VELEPDIMLDGVMRRLIDPLLDRAGGALARAKVADLLAFLGLLAGLAAAAAIVAGADGIALALVVASGTLDGLGNATARASRRTDRGGYIIVFDFIFYGAVRSPSPCAIRTLMRLRPRCCLAPERRASWPSRPWRARAGSRVRGAKASISPPATEGRRSSFSSPYARSRILPVLAYGFGAHLMAR